MNIDSVQVALRIRPMARSEINGGCRNAVEKIPNEPQVLVKGSESFTYNYVFDENDSQQYLYDSVVCKIIPHLFTGYNVTILAYGQTGSGKTYTMGTTFDGCVDDQMGIIPRAIFDIFEKINEMGSEYIFKVTCSFVELYQEQLYDLLAANTKERSIVDIREDSNRGIVIPGLNEIVVTSAKDTIDCLIRGSCGRAVAATAMNGVSSRSHAIFTVIIEKAKTNDSNCLTTSKFHLVDLAGSERSKKTKATGERFKEGVKINEGLLALGNVISKLGTGAQSSNYVGYRDSKLTRLLKDSLGGNSITLMIACVSPADYNLDETLSTLRYADRARKIKNKPVVNKDPKVAEINHLQEIIQKLRMELISRESSNSSFTAPDLCELKNKLNNEIARNNKLQQQLQVILNDVAESEVRAEQYKQMKDEFETKFIEIKNVVQGIDKNNLNECFEQIEKLQELIGGVDEIIEKNKETVANQRASYSHGNNSNETYGPDEIIQQKMNAFNTKQLDYNNELRRINRELNLKEELYEKYMLSMETFCSYRQDDPSVKIGEYESQIKILEDEKKELIEKLNCVKGNASAKLAEERRKRLHQLENELTDLKKKNTQQSKLLKMREKDKQKIVNLEKEIQEMKSLRVKLIREMKNESEKFRQWKLAREKEVVQLKEKDRKQQNEIAKMKVLHNKQKNVLKRKLEEAVAANKRLKDNIEKTRIAQSQRYTVKNGKIDGMISFLQQELEVIFSVIDADHSLKQLIKDRTTISKRLNDIKNLPGTDPEIKTSLEEELTMRNAHIDDLQRKIVVMNVEGKINAIIEHLQTMVEARAVIKHLFSELTEKRKEYKLIESQFQEYKMEHESVDEKVEELEKKMIEIQENFSDERSKLERAYEEKVIILLKELNQNPKGINGEITDQMRETMKIQEETLEKLEELREELEYYKSLYENLKKETETMKPQNKRLTNIKYGIATTNSPILFEEEIFSEDNDEYEDDTSDDPDWVRTPVFKRRNTVQSHTLRDVTVNNKRSFEKMNYCSCKGSCVSKHCGCRKGEINCTTNCRCPENCSNNKKQAISHQTSSEDDSENNYQCNQSENVDKENMSEATISGTISMENDCTENTITPKKLRLDPPDFDITTPSYPFSIKKRKPLLEI